MYCFLTLTVPGSHIKHEWPRTINSFPLFQFVNKRKHGLTIPLVILGFGPFLGLGGGWSSWWGEFLSQCVKNGRYAAGRNVADRGYMNSCRSDILVIVLILPDTVLTRTLSSYVQGCTPSDWSFLDEYSVSVVILVASFQVTFVIANTRALSLQLTKRTMMSLGPLEFWFSLGGGLTRCERFIWSRVIFFFSSTRMSFFYCVEDNLITIFILCFWYSTELETVQSWVLPKVVHSLLHLLHYPL